MNFAKPLLQLLLLLMVLASSPFKSEAQVKSFFGEEHTLKGHLHALIVFISYEDTNGNPVDKYPTANTNIWPVNGIPTWSDPNVSSNDFFDRTTNHAINGTGKKNLSKYYYNFSGGEFEMTGYVYPNSVIVNYSSYSNMNRAAINEIAAQQANGTGDPNFNWSDFDQRENNPNFSFDNATTGPDGKLDFVIFIHRIGPGSGGLGGTLIGGTTIPNTTYSIASGGGFTATYTPNDAPHNWHLFVHEAGHVWWNGPHTMNQNGVVGNNFYTNNGWGMLSPAEPSFFTPTAFQSWWLGWIPDLGYKDVPVLAPGDVRTVRVKDFADEQDAIRVEIPFTQGKQHLWIEYHEKDNTWDERLFYTNLNQWSLMDQGLYMYVTKGGSDREPPAGTGLDWGFANGNDIKTFNRHGKKDWVLTNGIVTNPNGGSTQVWNAVADNPIAGMSTYNGIRGDYDEDGCIQLKTGNNLPANGSGTCGALPADNETRGIMAEIINGVKTFTNAAWGKHGDAFKDGDELNLSGIFPVLNYPDFNKTSNKLTPFYLNGLSIRVLGYDSGPNEYLVEIRHDDWEVRNDKRWCGNIILPAGYEVNIDKQVTVDLDKSGTVDRYEVYPGTDDFITPSLLTIETGANLHLDDKSNFVVKNGSTLLVEAGGGIEVHHGATLRVESEGLLHLADASGIYVHEGGKVVIESTGQIYYGANTSITLNGNNSILEINGDFEIGPNALFTFSGKGHIVFGLPSNNGYANILVDNTSSILLEGTGFGDKIIEVKNKTYVHPGTTTQSFQILNGRVEMGKDAYINTGNADFTFSGLYVLALDPKNKHKGLISNGQVNHLIENCTITNGHFGIRGYQFWNQGAALRMENMTITDCGTGLWVSEKGTDLTEVNFSNCTIGYDHVMPTFSSTIRDSRFNVNDYMGVNYNSGGGDLMLDNCEVRFNGQDGVHFGGSATLAATCGKISENSVNATNGAGIYLGYNSVLDLDNEAMVDLTDNYGSIRLALAADFLLESGNNHLLTNPEDQGRCVYGTLFQFTAGNIVKDAKHNRWNDRGSSPAGKSPSQGADYDIQTANGFNVDINDSAPIFPNVLCAVSGDGGNSGIIATGNAISRGDLAKENQAMEKAALLIDQALVWNASGKRQNALNLLEKAIPMAAAEQLDMVLYYKCVISTILLVEEGHLNIWEFDSHLNACLNALSDQKETATLPIGDHSSSLSLEIFPNPSQGAFQAQVTGGQSEEIHLRITNILGRVVYSEKVLPNQKTAINWAEMGNGIYFVTGTDGSEEITERLIIQQ